MHTLHIIKYCLNKVYRFLLSRNELLTYKKIVIIAFTSGSRKILYLLRLLFPLNRLISRLFLIFAGSYNIFTSLFRDTISFVSISAELSLLMLHNFMVFYEVILTIRIVVEWYASVNWTEGGIFEHIIFNLSEPYLKASEQILPRGLSAIFAFLLVDRIKSFINVVYRTLVIYGEGSIMNPGIEIVNLLVFTLSLYRETILPY